MHTRIRKWDRWLADLIAEQMLSTNTTFLTLNMLGAIYNRKLNLSRGNYLYNLIYNSLMVSVIVNLSALWDPQFKSRRKRVQTLRALLEEMESQPHLLSKRRLLGKRPIIPNTDEPIYTTAASNYESHRRLLNKLIGVRCTHFKKDEITKDIRRVSRALKNVDFLRNKYIAHIDSRRRSRKKVSVDLHKAIETMNTVFEKYFVLLKGYPGSGVMPKEFKEIDSGFCKLFDSNPTAVIQNAWENTMKRIKPKKLQWQPPSMRDLLALYSE